MIKETITYKDFPDDEGNEPDVTETLRFNISKAELTENLWLKDDLEELQKVLDSQDGVRQLTMDEVGILLRFIKNMMKIAYGEQEVDARTGRRIFAKEGRWDSFEASRAYDHFITSLFENPDKAMNFIVQVMPRELVEAAAKQEGVDAKVLQGDFSGLKEQHPMSMDREGEKPAPKPVEDVALPEVSDDTPDDERYKKLKTRPEATWSRDDVLFMMKYDQRKREESDGTREDSDLRQFSDMMRWRKVKPRETTPRDRSLRGKQRIKARKDANKQKKVEA